MTTLADTAKLLSRVTKVTHRMSQLFVWSSHRLKAIEDRLAVLDGGDDAESAKRSAVTAENIRRIEAREQPLGFRLDARGKVIWDE